LIYGCNIHPFLNFWKGLVQGGVFIFSNPADQKSHVEAFTYESSMGR
jgi:hypothetical protein